MALSPQESPTSSEVVDLSAVVSPAAVSGAGEDAALRPATPSVCTPCCVCRGSAKAEGEGGNSAEALGFQLVQHFSLKTICIREWKCMQTGVRVLLCRIASPLCNLYATLPTEAHTDEGLPHTLEHLVFLGSRRFPYKGVLDFLANRCLSQGTNAWTATDHTTYTLTTAGSEGLLNLLPVYLDHLMIPTLHDNAFKTEVHHLTQNAGSAGVVYSEMEARERQASSVLYRKLVELVYPGDSGYRYETGGLMEQIRRTSNARVREYHKNFYKWSNLSLIVTGLVEATSLLDTVRRSIKQIEEAKTLPAPPALSACPELDAQIAKAVGPPEHGERPLAFSGERPWTDDRNVRLPASPSSPQSSSPAFHRVYFPADDAESGRVALAWRGPAWKDALGREVVDILGSYLSEGNVAPLQRELVQCDDPVCATVDFSSENFRETSFFLEAADVRLEGRRGGERESEKETRENACKKQKREEDKAEEERLAENRELEAVGKRIQEIIAREAEGPLDLARLRMLLRRELLQFYRALETNPHDTMAELLNEYIVNHRHAEDLQSFLNLAGVVNSLAEQPETFWRGELRRWFLNSSSAFPAGVACYPSTSLASKLHAEDQAREARLRESVGEAQLAKLAATVEEIKVQQKQPPPKDVLLSVPVASIDKVVLPDKAPLSNFDDPRDEEELREGTREERKEKGDAKRGGETTCQTGGEEAKKRGEDVLSRLPFPVQLDAQATEFVQIKLLSRIPENLSPHERRALLLLADLVFECDVLFPAALAEVLHVQPSCSPCSSAGSSSNAGECVATERQNAVDVAGYVRVSYEQLTRLVFEHATSSSAGLGFHAESGAGAGSASLMYDLFSLSITAPVDRYFQATALLFGVLCGLQIEAARVSVHLKRHLKQLVRKKRSAKFLVQQLETSLRYRRGAVPNSCGWGQQLATMKRMQKDLAHATQTLITVYRHLFQQLAFGVHIVADVAQLPAGWEKPWRDLQALLAARPMLLDLPLAGEKHEKTESRLNEKTPDGETEKDKEPWGKKKKFAAIAKVLGVRPSACDNVFAEPETQSGRGKMQEEETRIACGIGSSDAGHVLVSVKGPVGYGEKNKDLAAIMVMAECCSMMEGLLFRTVRGAGFAYGCDFAYFPWQGQLTLRLSPATNPAAAVKAVVEEFRSRVQASIASGTRIFSDEEIVAGKCGTLFSIVSREETQSCQAAQSLIWPLRGQTRDENRRLLDAVANTTAEEVEAVARVYLHSVVVALTGSDEERERVGGTVCIVTNKKKAEGTVKDLEAAGVRVTLVHTEHTLRQLQLGEGDTLSDLGEEEEDEEEGEDEDEDEDEDEEEEGDDEDDEDACCGGEREHDAQCHH
ncbi:peptidase M16 inactive domain-containing protein [Toxoplasma gondii ME49]|uniref:Peptidase M16 inactive domain-containing protein n=3 Tax=Toxoplasma gondii TaxID=5811 RepID=A0A2G8XW64_TOXGO|nr:peptidase M16 inactive domain-containing protein [Toxoplasma gondii ME49]EPT26538.1 peptidase M16 inactive domain-containing protein [Toxoplasma gondii ME49]KFG35959.1 peptidase M16 inactive domain-containing protein [Toxoplasma gondii GAB2-2007-GAL-DOM2]PIL99270.1 peptidase M16 inactive domain-containing protein [Toxoplasma gondii COUG]|eukprot:XP_002370780.1 peptidase M16 inactive domain-containing protein [Toxoplasma gondii ME49]